MAAPVQPPIVRIGIIAKAALVEAAAHLVDLEGWLSHRGVAAVFETKTSALMPPSASRTVADKRALAGDVGMVLVLGGDGTLLGMADCIGEVGSGIPILGVNFGSLGFLTEITLPELYPSLEAALAGEVHLEERAMLRGLVRRGGAIVARHVATNDVVITKGARARMIELSISVGDEFMTRVRADGLIIATPTGSTAYNLAAGGPIAHPTLDALIVTPIAPHTLTNRPVVVPAHATIGVQPATSGRDELHVTFDGQTAYDLHDGDEIVVAQADVRLRLIKPTTRSYFQVLRTKLKWGER
jgi:NAD+ kinase